MWISVNDMSIHVKTRSYESMTHQYMLNHVNMSHWYVNTCQCMLKHVKTCSYESMTCQYMSIHVETR
jgi:hypothetical protein